MEKRTVRTTTVLNDYLDWPEVGQVYWLERERTEHGKTTKEDVYGITSLTRAETNAAQLLDITRGHWGIENRLHHVRDVTFAEDASRVRKGSAPTVLASLRNAALPLLRSLELASVANAIRACAFRPRLAVRLVLEQR